MKRAILALIFAAIPLGTSAQVPHGWIQRNPNYIAISGSHCCGSNHCQPALPGEIERIPDGWRHVPTNTVLKDNDRGVYPSIDAQLWRCVWGGRLQCVFWSAGT